MTETLDCVVIGGGVIGLAVGRALARAGRDVIVLEAEPDFGQHTSSRNSEVIHAGIYYPAGSLKARLCVQGKRLLYDFCRERGVDHRRTGKLIVAESADDTERLLAIRDRAAANGVDDLELIDGDELKEREPQVRGAQALYSPSTGIIDSHALMLALLADLEEGDGMLVCNARVDRVQRDERGFVLQLADQAEQYLSRTLINCAGHGAPTIARAAGQSGADVPTPRFAKGHYFAYTGKPPFQHLVYPLPEAAGLGIHATIDLGGQVRFGPDVVWTDSLDYSFDANRAAAFVAAIEAYFPDVQIERLNPSYTGIRPKLVGPGDSAADFRIDGPARHGIPGLVNLMGIESPGLTASLAIAEYVVTAMAQSE